MRFSGARVGDEIVDIDVHEGVITRMAPPGGPQPLGATIHVLNGQLITPALAEPHVHLDAALLGTRAPNKSGTLREGIANWAALRDTLDRRDFAQRASDVLDLYASWGCLRVRTHVDTGSRAAVEAMLALRDAVAGRCDLQVVAFPQEGILTGPGRQEAWQLAVELGCDAVGAIPHLERTADEGWRSLRMAFDLAEQRGIRVDLHCDETDDPGSRNLEVACAETIDRGLGGRVVAGHCTALHSYPNPHAAKVIDLVARSGVQVVCNPLDNVVLQGRYDGYPRRRGLTRVDELWDAGAIVGFGHDLIVDPWYRLGTGNLVDAAYMAVHVGHLTSEAQMVRAVRTLWTDNHRPFWSLPKIAVGEPATFCWWPVTDEIELLRLRPRPRVFRDGVEIARA